MKATFSSRTSYKIPIALCFSLDNRMILRPDPPSWPLRGCTCSTRVWKCCSKSCLRTSMNMVSSDPVFDGSLLRYSLRLSPIAVSPIKITSNPRRQTATAKVCQRRLVSAGPRPLYAVCGPIERWVNLEPVHGTGVLVRDFYYRRIWRASVQSWGKARIGCAPDPSQAQDDSRFLGTNDNR